jgi:aquacobalamin reductase/NAD(P)H-flavin reductase
MTIKTKVKSIEPLACNTFKVLLQPESAIDFKAGQYLMVVMSEKDKRPFSIASSPCRSNRELELHIGAANHNAYAIEVVDAMRQALEQQSCIDIDAPYGDAWLQEDSTSPLLLIAGGTGFSYTRSILDHCLAQQISRPIYLYWGAKDPCQLYAKDDLVALDKQHDNFNFIPVVEVAESEWQGKMGNVLQAVMQDFESLATFDIYLAGRFDMAGAARELFTSNKNARRERMFADAYSFI